jgi:hypothetical protein
MLVIGHGNAGRSQMIAACGNAVAEPEDRLEILHAVRDAINSKVDDFLAETGPATAA